MPRPEIPYADVLAGEILGAAIVVEKAPGLAKRPLKGTLVDETLQTFRIRTARDGRIVVVPKAGLEATLFLGGRQIPLKGDSLRVRPEDRTKRLAPRGRRS